MGSFFSRNKYKNPAAIQQELEQLNKKLEDLEQKEKRLERWKRKKKKNENEN